MAPPAGLGEQRLNFDQVVPFRMHSARARRCNRPCRAGTPRRQAFADFCERHAELDDYALFMALAEQHNWRDGGLGCAAGGTATRSRWPRRATHAERIAFWTFCQWCFFRQWLAR